MSRKKVKYGLCTVQLSRNGLVMKESKRKEVEMMMIPASKMLLKYYLQTITFVFTFLFLGDFFSMVQN